jgi:hypothetical protein
MVYPLACATIALAVGIALDLAGAPLWAALGFGATIYFALPCIKRSA